MRNSKGAVLPLVIIAVVILLLLGSSLLMLGGQARMLAIRATAEIAAQCAADAGMAQALHDLNNTTWDDAHLPAQSNIALPNSDESFTYTVTKNGGSGVYTITATGTCGNRTRTVTAPLGLSSFPYAILMGSSLYMKNNALINGSCGVLSAASGAFDISNGTVISDAFVGVGGNAGDITCNVQGQKYALESPITLFPVTVPVAAQTANPNNNWDTPNNYTLGTPGAATYVRYTGVTINGTLSISGDVVMYVNGDLSSVGSGINVNPGSTLRLYITGNLGPGGNGVDLSSTDNDPGSLGIFGVGAGAQDFCFGKNKDSIMAGIYAPKAKVTIGKNKATITGSVVADSLEVKNSADFTYDQRASNSMGSIVPGSKYTINKVWQEY